MPTNMRTNRFVISRSAVQIRSSAPCGPDSSACRPADSTGQRVPKGSCSGTGGAFHEPTGARVLRPVPPSRQRSGRFMEGAFEESCGGNDDGGKDGTQSVGTGARPKSSHPRQTYVSDSGTSLTARLFEGVLSDARASSVDGHAERPGKQASAARRLAGRICTAAANHGRNDDSGRTLAGARISEGVLSAGSGRASARVPSRRQFAPCTEGALRGVGKPFVGLAGIPEQCDFALARAHTTQGVDTAGNSLVESGSHKPAASGSNPAPATKPSAPAHPFQTGLADSSVAMCAQVRGSRASCLGQSPHQALIPGETGDFASVAQWFRATVSKTVDVGSIPTGGANG